MRRTLTAAAAALALGAATMLGAVPAGADPEEPEGLPALTPGDKVSEPLRAAEGQVTAFVQLDAPSALDVAEQGGEPADSAAAAAAVEDLAEEVVPSRAGARSALGAAPQRLSVTSKLVSGTIVAGAAEQVRALADSDDVVALYLVPLHEPTNKGVDALTRADEVWQSLGATGAGIRMGIIDTGIDYTHATFGGPGTAEAYAAAYGEDGTGEIPEGLFDDAKFLGGYDFAGTYYDASGRIPDTTVVPQPDPNPIDAPYTRDHSGHGTHVAATAAGYGVTDEGETFRGDYAELEDISDWEVGPGSAPEAGIYALKVFGDFGGSTGVTINALEWAADPDGDFDFNDRLDVVNLSLGAATAPVDDPESLFVNRLTDLGTLSVMSAGNAGDAFDVDGSPGNAASSLAVANSVGDTMTFDAVEVTDAEDESLLGLHPAQNTVAYAGTEDAEGPVVYLGEGVDGCEPLTEYAEQVAGAIVWLYWDDGPERACGSAARWANATAVGAAGVLIGTEEAVFSAGIAGDAETPGAQLTAESTDRLLPEIQAGTLSVRLGPSYSGVAFTVDESVADTLNPGSSRGAHGSLGIIKPDVAAPGTRIFSAASSTGTGGHALTGTSMSAPHVAGIAALVRESNPGWSPEQVKAGIMNTATHPVYRDPGPTGPVFGPERVGAGRVDAYAAVGNGVIAYDSAARDLVSVTFGVVDVGAEEVVLRRTVTVQNLGAEGPATFSTGFEATSTTGGATITTTPATIEVAPGASRTVTVTLTADPDTLVREIDPTQDPVSAVGVPREYVASLSGRLVLEPTGEQDTTLHVPVHAAPRLVSEVSAQPVEFPGPDALSAPLAVTGRHVDSGGWTSLVTALELVATSPQLEPIDEGVETSPSQVAAGDIRYVGAMSTAPRVAEAGYDPSLGYLGIGVAVQGQWPTLGTTTVPVIDIDLDGDGTPDLQTIVSKVDTGIDVTLATTVNFATGEVLSQAGINGLWGDTASTVYDNTVLVAPIPLALFEPGAEPSFSVWTHSGYAPSANDVVDAVEPFTYDPYAPDLWTTGGALNDLWVPSDTELTLHRAADAGEDFGPLLVLHSNNVRAERAQVVDVAVGEVVATPTTTTLTVDGDPAPGSELTLTAMVEPAEASGTVTFRDGDTELDTVALAAGRASTTTTLAPGSHSLTAQFTPDSEQWEPSVSEPVLVEVAAAESTTSLRLSRSLASYGTVTTATVTVEAEGAAPSGEVEIHSRDAVVATGTLEVDGHRGTAEVELPAGLPAGSHRLTAVYPGSAEVEGSSSRAVRYTVLPALPRMSIATGPDRTVQVAVQGRAGAPTPTGSVAVTAGLRVVGRAELDENGIAEVRLPRLWTRTVVIAAYSGDHGYLPGVTARVVSP